MANFVKVATRAEIPEAGGKLVEVAGRKIALFNAGGTFYAIGNECKHRGGALADGELDGTHVICPLHGWEYDVTTGENVDDPSISVGCYQIKIDGDDILIDV